MHFFATLALATSTLFSVVSAANFTIIVGENSQNVFSPTSITGAQVGDIVSFQFVSKNHTATQSTFATPCVAKAGGVNSGFVPANATAATFPEWTIQLNNVSAPLWFYCAQTGHCQSGMVFAINPTADKTFAAFQAAAEGSTSVVAASGSGATVVTTPASDTTATAATASTTTTNGALGLSVRTTMSVLAALGLIASLTL